MAKYCVSCKEKTGFKIFCARKTKQNRLMIVSPVLFLAGKIKFY